MADRERTERVLASIVWKNTPDVHDLAEVTRFRSEGRSHPSGVAEVMMGEVREMFSYELPGPENVDFVAWLLDRQRQALYAGPYTAAARIVLEAEGVLSTGRSGWDDMYDRVYLDKLTGGSRSVSIEETEAHHILSAVYHELRGEEYARILQENGALTLVDYFVNRTERGYRNSGLKYFDDQPWWIDANVSVLRKGQARFHSLHAATYDIEAPKKH